MIVGSMVPTYPWCLPSSPSTPSSRPVSDFHSQSLIYYIQASGTPQPIHFLKAHDDNEKDKDAKRIAETLTVCYTFGMTQTFQTTTNNDQKQTTNNDQRQTINNDK